VYALVGLKDSARAIVSRVARGPNPPSYHLASAYAALGDDTSALEWLERGYTERSDWIPMIRYDRAFDRLRPKARFKAIEAKLKLP